jgi:hypothetical protein
LRPPQDHQESTQPAMISRWPSYVQHRHTARSRSTAGVLAAYGPSLAEGGASGKPSWEEPGESFAAPPQLLLVAVAVLSAVLGGTARCDRGVEPPSRRPVQLIRVLLRPVRGRGGGTGPRCRRVRRLPGRPARTNGTGVPSPRRQRVSEPPGRFRRGAPPCPNLDLGERCPRFDL